MKRIVLVVLMSLSLGAGAGFAGDEAKVDEPCTEHSVVGTYGFSLSGASSALGFTAAAGSITADGKGHLSGSYTKTVSGLLIDGHFVGTYTVEADCTVSVSVGGASWHAEGKGMLVNEGKEVLWVGAQTDIAVLVSGVAKKH